MGSLRIKTNKYNYKKWNGQLKEQFMNRINDELIMGEIINKLITIGKTGYLTSEQLLVGENTTKAQKPRKQCWQVFRTIKNLTG